jgi:succinoglycan biosynthesis protein ExoM
MDTENKIVAICVATFKRPELLSNCLVSIGQIAIPDNYTPIIMVVDNDGERSGEASFNKATQNINFNSYYYVESDRGICSARNCLLEKALDQQADYIAFVDDDELTHKQWLVNMVAGLKEYPNDIIAGPVIPISGTTAPITFITDPKRPSGSIPRNIPAGNVLFSEKLINEHGLRFDRYFDFIGCEDFDFFDRAIKKKMTSVWIDNAIIFETILPERTTRKYIIYRHFTGGINVVMRYRRHHSLLFAWARYLPKALGKFIGAFVSLIKSTFVAHKENYNKFIIKFSNGIGYLAGLTNIVIERYRYK